MTDRTCLSCRRRAAGSARGLCSTCHRQPAVRRLFPTRPRGDYREPTEEELDALIAEQMRPENLPSWWPKSPDQQDRESRTQE